MTLNCVGLYGRLSSFLAKWLGEMVRVRVRVRVRPREWTRFLSFCLFLVLHVLLVKLCVEWGSTNTGWHIDIHHVKNFFTHMKCEVKHNGDMGMGHLWLIMGGAFRVWLWLKWVGQL